MVNLLVFIPCTSLGSPRVLHVYSQLHMSQKNSDHVDHSDRAKSFLLSGYTRHSFCGLASLTLNPFAEVTMAASAIAQMHAIARVSSAAASVNAKAQAPLSVTKKLSAIDRSTSLTRKASITSKPRFTVCAAADVEVAGETKTQAEPRRGGRARREVTVQFEDIAVGKVYPGTVQSVQAYGAFVNFGAKSDGLVHISELKEGFVENVSDVVSQGQAVEVRVVSIDGQK
eukprot:4931003-Pyramimonas_sp.AAC.1